jgi:hypothetical protein
MSSRVGLFLGIDSYEVNELQYRTMSHLLPIMTTNRLEKQDVQWLESVCCVSCSYYNLIVSELCVWAEWTSSGNSVLWWFCWMNEWIIQTGNSYLRVLRMKCKYASGWYGIVYFVPSLANISISGTRWPAVSTTPCCCQRSLFCIRNRNCLAFTCLCRNFRGPLFFIPQKESILCVEDADGI